ncbi:hypothetical protein DENSPDRAFT_837561 [Dentipellis sp. KUC8613]|nr:hypothetical protein DENSPDRAFT_837561 [Dentipellis sp. KUC8613]
MASTDPWADFESLKASVRHNTVARLQQIIGGLNDSCWALISKTGKKQELIDRITKTIDDWRVANNVDKWNQARAVFYQVRNSGMYTSSGHAGAAAMHSAPFASAATNAPYASTSVVNSAVPRYDVYSVPRRPGPVTAASTSMHTSGSQAITFKPSPFYHVEQVVSNVVECPESSSSLDRRQSVVLFTLNQDQITKLTSTSPKYQLRLYCTSSSYYTMGPGIFRASSNQCPIEFPPTCEVRVNQIQISANMKGLKKKPGTAPPADIGKNVRHAGQNRVEMVYVNSQTNNNQAPPPPKKYYMAVMLVRVTSTDQLIDALKKGKYKSSTEILAKMKQSVSDDDEIVAGPQKMSLKCPLSYIRITTPCRSIHCVHPQCFDAMSWLCINEQTTTWTCPICEKVLSYDDLFVDGYFEEILKVTPESVEDVMVEADGEWHSSDNKFGSAAWKAAHKPAVDPAEVARAPPTPRSPSSAVNGTSSQKAKDVEVFELDSDDEDDDEGRVKRELSPSWRAGSSVQSGPPESQVIDLTLDSDEEEYQAAVAGAKRKAADMPSPTEQIWKKSRVEGPPANAVMRSVNGNVDTSTSASSASGSNTGARPYRLNGNLPQPHSPPVPPTYPHSPYATPYLMPFYPPSTLNPAARPKSDPYRRTSDPYTTAEDATSRWKS